jgi:predicted short-subunit dehydrogenase-like oxidoreductase (DUF2520 family)
VNRVEPTGTLALVGPGRAGTTIAGALAERGWDVIAVAGRRPDAPSTIAAASRLGASAVALDAVATDADLVVVATPDAAVEQTARVVAGSVSPDALVIHLSGGLGLEVLSALPSRVGALHPLQTFPSASAGTARLAGSWCAIAGDPEVRVLAEQLGLRPVEVADADRVRYHAAACIASNHLAALLDQVQRVAPIPLDAYLPLVRATVDNVEAIGPRAALTGPVARGDVATVRDHLAVLAGTDPDAYRALARLARGLTGRDDAELDALLR